MTILSFVYLLGLKACIKMVSTRWISIERGQPLNSRLIHICTRDNMRIAFKIHPLQKLIDVWLVIDLFAQENFKKMRIELFPPFFLELRKSILKAHCYPMVSPAGHGIKGIGD